MPVRSAKPRHRVRRLSSWTEFRELVTGGAYATWAFRGQHDAALPLSTSLYRHLAAFGVDRRAWAHQEERIARIFRRKAHNYLRHVPPPDDHFQWQALIEHHGGPTRLLDFTWSPWVAAFFALQSATHDSAVWAVDPAAVLRIARRVAGGGRSLPADRIDPRHPENYRRHFQASRRAFAWIGEPETMNARLVAQSGTFAMTSIIDRTLEDILGAHDPACVVELVLPARLRDSGLRELYVMNITHATLFPDLDGLARSLAYELEFHWAFDPRTMRALGTVPRAFRELARE